MRVFHVREDGCLQPPKTRRVRTRALPENLHLLTMSNTIREFFVHAEQVDHVKNADFLSALPVLYEYAKEVAKRGLQRVHGLGQANVQGRPQGKVVLALQRILWKRGSIKHHQSRFVFGTRICSPLTRFTSSRAPLGVSKSVCLLSLNGMNRVELDERDEQGSVPTLRSPHLAYKLKG